MAATDLLILPGDVLLIPVEELAADVRAQLECNEGDFAISRRRARAPSRIIDRDGAQFLQEFQTPKTIIEAILTYCQTRQLNPRDVLENAFPLLQSLCNSRMLVPFESKEAEPIEPSYEIGAVVAGCEVVRCAQVLEDSEVYQVRSQDGEVWALKSVRPGVTASAVEALTREASLLKQLDRVYTPALLAHGEFEERPYLIMEWCNGLTASIAAETLRRSKDGTAAFRLIDLCCAILEAYAHLHAQAVVHADVHPRNILIGDDSVKIVDFGLARFEKSTDGLTEPRRGGIGFYFEPEYASASLLGKSLPAASKLGEQYALGALLYFLFTGMHYLDFSPEREKTLRQIIRDEPLPFSRRGVESLTEVEEVLIRALKKNPAERYSTVDEFEQQLRLAGASFCADSTRRTTERLPQEGPIGAGLIHTVMSRLGTSGNLLGRGLSLAPTGSVSFGAAGVAYMFYRMACLKNEPQLLFTADLWSNRAKMESDRPSAFYNSQLEITEENVDASSLYHTVSGVHCVDALINYAMGDFSSASEAVYAFASASTRPGRNLDLTLGKSGILIGCATLLEAMPDQLLVEDGSLSNLGARVLDSVCSQIDDCGPITECRELPWLGIAHGWAGVLFAALRWCQASRTEVASSVEERLWQLNECAESVGRSVCWSRKVQDGVVWPGWCHGTAGYVHLWILAHKIYREEKFFQLAQKSAWHTRENANGSNGSLCCGLAGQAYALLSLYRYTGEKEWLTGAREIGVLAVSTAGASGLRTNSLYKGDVGIALLAAELSYPELSCMPLFESE